MSNFEIVQPWLRLAMFGVPGPTELVGKLSRSFETIRFSSGHEDDQLDDRDCTSYWHISASTLGSSTGARNVLRNIVLRSVVGRLSFVMGFGFSEGELSGIVANADPRALLDLSDIWSILRQHAVMTSYDNIGALGRVPMTPIEQQLALALDSEGIGFTPQAKIGRYRADFLIENPGRKIVVEADGAAFHDPVKDADRDASMRALGVEQVLRFSGSQIFRDAAGCVSEIQRCLSGASPRSPRFELDPDLDESQMRAVHHGAGPARVLAPAGSGKTKTLVNRVLHLLNRGVEPDSIIVLAFNKKAADQLLDRFGSYGVPLATRIAGEKSDGVFCSTFHSFGWRYLREIASLTFETSDARSFWRQVMEQALSDSGTRIEDLKPKRGSDPIGTLLKQLELVKSDLQPASELVVEFETYGSTPVSIPFQPVFDCFSDIALKSGKITFDDLLYIPVQDLTENRQHREMLQSRFQHVLVDEFQDLNAAQLAIVDILSRPLRDLYVVGDDDQLIYGWRFAKASNILQFLDRYTTKEYASDYVLGTNYRCSRAIVEKSKNVISKNRNRVEKDFSADSAARHGRAQLLVDASWENRKTAVVNFLRNEHSVQGAKWGDLAILCRYRNQQPLIAAALDDAGIPRSTLLHYRLYSHPVALVLRSYTAIVIEPEKAPGTDWSSVINQPNRYVSNDVAERLSTSDGPLRVLEEFAAGSTSVAKGPVVSFLSSVDKLHGEYLRATLDPRTLIDRLSDEFGLHEYWSDHTQGASTRCSDDPDPSAVIASLELLAAKSPSLPDLLVEWDARISQERAMHDMEQDTLRRELPADSDVVVLGTIHSAKGREYQSVVLFDYDSHTMKKGQSETEEERRVLYVGITRARHNLLITFDGPPGELDPRLAESLTLVAADERAACTEMLSESIVTLSEKREALEAASQRLAFTSSGDALREVSAVIDSKEVEARDSQQVQEGMEAQLPVGFGPRLTTALSGRLGALKREIERQRLRRQTLAAELVPLEKSRRALTHTLEEVLDEIQRDLDYATAALRDAEGSHQRVQDRLDEIALLEDRSSA